MATTKKTTEKKETTFEINAEQVRTLKRLSEILSDVSINLADLKGSDDLSSIMYDIGSCVNDIDRCGDKLDQVIDSFNYHEWLDDEA